MYLPVWRSNTLSECLSMYQICVWDFSLSVSLCLSVSNTLSECLSMYQICVWDFSLSLSLYLSVSSFVRVFFSVYVSFTENVIIKSLEAAQDKTRKIEFTKMERKRQYHRNNRKCRLRRWTSASRKYTCVTWTFAELPAAGRKKKWFLREHKQNRFQML